MNAPARPSTRYERDEAVPIDTLLRFLCPFLGCNATRLHFEGGKPLFFNGCDTCPRCEFRIALTPDEKAFASIVAKGLL